MRGTMDCRFRGPIWGVVLAFLLTLLSPPAARDAIAADAPLAVADAVLPLLDADDARVLEGLRVFTEEKFGGNGRTCATCHPPTNNFTIDPAHIRTLPSTDPLFVAEFDANLRKLERPGLLRQLGLVVVNSDGFDVAGVSRAVPHTLGLSQTTSAGKTPFPFAHMTGWSGDGSPGDGSLRSFTLGAVAQHLPRTLARRACTAAQYDPSRCDFRVPTDTELDELLEFQLFLGRQAEVNIEPFSSKPNEIIFLDDFAEAGKLLFHAVAGGNDFSCSSCHRNAGANDSRGNGRLFPLRIQKHPDAPSCRRPGVAPGDGGFGREPRSSASGKALCGTANDFRIEFFGNNHFNTPSLVEAADTPPFFHNNIVNTIEKAVEFYTTAEFARSASGIGIAFNFSTEEVRQIAAMLRALNALQNMENGDRYARLAQRAALSQPEAATTLVKIAASETEDAIQVLTTGPFKLYAGTGVTSLLQQALAAERQAISAWNPTLLDTAIALKAQARNRMVQ